MTHLEVRLLSPAIIHLRSSHKQSLTVKPCRPSSLEGSHTTYMHDDGLHSQQSSSHPAGAQDYHPSKPTLKTAPTPPSLPSPPLFHSTLPSPLSLKHSHLRSYYPRQRLESAHLLTPHTRWYLSTCMPSQISGCKSPTFLSYTHPPSPIH